MAKEVTSTSSNKPTNRSSDRMQVRISHLDKLLALAGEVIITSSTLHDLQRDLTNLQVQDELLNSCTETIKEVNESARRISQDLHDLVMAIRLIEVGETLRKFKRPIRDLCRGLGREVDLLFQGDDVLIDKALAEGLVDPLLHLLRNAVDHGIESPLERSKVGKPEKGTIEIIVEDNDAYTLIEIVDDGRGIDAEKIFSIANEKGFSSGGEDLLTVLSNPGFSTRDVATATSGRGVGLDIVQEMIHQYTGSIELQTEVGKGTKFSLEIPKLRAVNIIDSLLIAANSRIYAMPIDQVAALRSYQRSEIITSMDSNWHVKYLDEIVNLFDLSEIFGMEPVDVEQFEFIPVIIVESRNEKVAFIVSEFLNPQKLVNVPLSKRVFSDGARGIAGTTVISGGRIGLTIDVEKLVAIAIGGDFYAEDIGAQLIGETEEALDKLSEEFGGDLLAAASELSEVTAKDAEKVGTETDAADAKEEKKAGYDVLLDTEVKELLEDTLVNINQLQEQLLNLENAQEEEKRDCLNEAFRCLHASKGHLTMVQYDTASDLSHKMETALDYMRGNRVEVTPEAIDVLLDGVTYLKNTVSTANAALVPDEKIAAELENLMPEEDAADLHLSDNVLDSSFSIEPTAQLQLLSALKRGESTFETHISFNSGRQAEFLVGYLILRRIGLEGSIISTLPSVGEIEEGYCSGVIKLLWSTNLSAEEVQQFFDDIAPMYGITEFHTIGATIFKYEIE